MTAYQPPRDILQILQKIEFEEALAAGDPRYVQTQEARGSEQTLSRLAKKLGLNLKSGAFAPPLQKHALFFGHIGSGKTTELRVYADALAKSGHFFVVDVDITVELDRNNLQYADALMALARRLLERCDQRQVVLGGDALEPMQKWFDERVQTSEEAKDFCAEIKVGGKAEGGIPFFSKLFAQFTSSFRANATYKDSLRRVIRNSFSELAFAFNRLLRRVEEALSAKAGKPVRVLFLLDGTDKMRREDTQQFFVYDAEQLLAVESFVIYTAPLSLKYEGNLAQKLDADLVLPMIKLNEKDDSPCTAGRTALREILLRRADRGAFAGEAEIIRLVETCGGHPRELLRLLKLCCEYADESIDAAAVDKAIGQLASDYRRFLEPEDYDLLVSIDADATHAGNDERTRKLLYNLGLLEYNDGSWRRSHPVVRGLDGYTRADAKRAMRQPD